MKKTYMSLLLTILMILAFGAYSLGTAADAQEAPARAYPPVSFEHFQVQHPRLFITDADLVTIHRKIDSDAFAKAEYDRLLTKSRTLLAMPVVEQHIAGPTGNFLWPAREIEDRVLTLSGMYRLTGDRRFADRAVKEMLHAATFPEWNPAHFLDVGELTATLGIGYDWLYPVLTADERATIRRAVLEKGLTPLLDRLHRNEIHYRNNWGQVVFGGETAGALAVAEPDDAASMARAAEIVTYARPAIDSLMNLFAPDGGFEEGPVYWNYALIYNVLYLDALDTALGTDFGESDATGFAVTPLYRIESIGPIMQYANFGDAHPEAFPTPQMYWFARRFHAPAYAAEERLVEENLRGNMITMTERESSRFGIFQLCWYALAPVSKTPEWPPLVKSFARINQSYMRTSFTDPRAWYVGYKGGEATASHGHLDLGSFVLDGLGERWGIDLAGDDYDLPGYFGKQRFDYYRTRTEGHNTLTIDDQNEDLDASATVSTAKMSGRDEITISNLDRVYKRRLQRWTRGLAILDGRRVLVQDELAPQGTASVTWHFHTRAEVAIAANGRSAMLTQGGTRILVRILAPQGAQFSTASAQPPAPQAPNPGVTDLVIRQEHVSGAETIAVTFSESSDAASAEVKPLSHWTTR